MLATRRHPARTRTPAAPLPRSAESASVAASDSDLGWIAVELVGPRVTRLTFGHSSRREALWALGWDRPHSDEAASAAAQRVLARVVNYAADGRTDLLSIEVDYGVTTPFQRRVLDACRTIGPGETLSYAELARVAGSPGAARAVGNVMRTNRLPLLVPCHRVIGSGGALGGYSAPDGLKMKQRLLALEGARKTPSA